MKYRKSFVTNSSSSSFVCEVCGDVESGWDMGFDDAGMVECENEHMFCTSHLLNPTRKQKIAYIKLKNPASRTIPFDKVDDKDLDAMLKKKCNIDLERYENDNNDFDWEIDEYPSLFCPICNLDYIPENLKLKYVLREIAKSEFALNKEIQSKFESLEDLKEFLKK